MKKRIKINKKLILILILINVLVIGISSSYALFEITIVKDSIIKIESGNTNITTTVEGYVNNSMTIPSGESNTINVTLTNPTDYDILYKMYYTITSGSGTIVALDLSDDLSGTMNNTKTLSFQVKNTGTSAITIEIGCKGALINSSIVLESGEYEFLTDIEPPVVTVSVSGNNTASPKLVITSNESGTYCVNTSSTQTDMSSCTFSGSITADTSLTTDALSVANTYYVHVQDGAGNIGISSGATITFDTQGPTVAVSVASSSVGQNSWYKSISIKGTATDDKSTVSSISYCTTTSTTCTPSTQTTASSTTVSITTSSTTAQRVCFNATDSVGNVGATVCSSAYKVDTKAPTISSVSNAGSGKVTFTASDSHSGVYQYCVNQQASSTTSCTWYTASSGSQTSGAVAASDGSYYIHLKDKAGNISHSSAVTITLWTPCASGTAIGSCLVSNPTTGLNATTAYSGMYRYIGEDVNNYVSLSGVIYRIIGITSSANSTLGLSKNQIKVMKATSIGSNQWHTSYTSNTAWTSTSIYTSLQGSLALSNTSVIPSAWVSKISSVKWYIGNTPIDEDDNYITGATVFSYEDNTVTSSTAKIGLLYLSDYFYANSDTDWTTPYNGCPSWLAGDEIRWMMTRYGYSSVPFNGASSSSANWAWYHVVMGSIGPGQPTNKMGINPVFYLATTVTYQSGSGTSTDPFIIS